MWKELKNIGLPSKGAQISKICFKGNDFTQSNFPQNLYQI